MIECHKCHEQARYPCIVCTEMFCQECYETCAICNGTVCGRCWRSKHRHKAAEIATT